MSRLVWFNVSVCYSAAFAGLAVVTESGSGRLAFVFFAVHGGLWAIYRAIDLVIGEHKQPQ